MTDIKAAGIAVRARDTGRVLMIQRSNQDLTDPARGRWEFPGGNLATGEDPAIGAQREWEEELGIRLPPGERVSSWASGVYQGFVYEVPQESDVKVNLDPKERYVLNPDDPDGDDIETAAWWDPKHLARMNALRDELRASRPWVKVAKAANVELHLHVVGVQTHPSGRRVYRMGTRDGHYIGRSNPTKMRAMKGDVVKVRAAHMKVTAQGDISWQNAELMALGGGYGHRADSHRALLDRIGGGNVTPDMALLGKDNATDVPPASDEKNIPEGPTSNSVHVNVPLKNMSIKYGGKQKRLKVVKMMGAQQLVYGIVLEPEVIDSQADYVPTAHVEKAAHRFLTKALRGGSSVTKLQHRTPAFHKSKPSVVPVESFIAPTDFTYPGSREPVKKGSWVLVVHVEDPGLWQDFLDGKYDGFSVGGSGLRQRLGSMMQPQPALYA